MDEHIFTVVPSLRGLCSELNTRSVFHDPFTTLRLAVPDEIDEIRAEIENAREGVIGSHDDPLDACIDALRDSYFAFQLVVTGHFARMGFAAMTGESYDELSIMLEEMKGAISQWGNIFRYLDEVDTCEDLSSHSKQVLTKALGEYKDSIEDFLQYYHLLKVAAPALDEERAIAKAREVFHEDLPDDDTEPLPEFDEDFWASVRNKARQLQDQDDLHLNAPPEHIIPFHPE